MKAKKNKKCKERKKIKILMKKPILPMFSKKQKRLLENGVTHGKLSMDHFIDDTFDMMNKMFPNGSYIDGIKMKVVKK